MSVPRGTTGLLVLAAAVVLVGGATALAGDYHSGSSLVCTDCHNMHYSQEHGYGSSPGGPPFSPDLGAGGAYTYLLRDEVNNLCLSCHDGSPFAPDVLEAGTGPAIRVAGGLNRVGGLDPLYAANDGHTLDSTDTAPGGTWAPDPGHVFECTSCHQPHGYGGPTTNPYRNLQGTLNGFTGAPTYETGGIPSNTVDVWQAVTLNYDRSNVQYQEPDTTQSGMGQWCGQCHTDFYGTNTAADIAGSGDGLHEFVRHPVAGVDIGAVGGGHSSADVYWDPTGAKTNFVKVMSPSATWPNPAGNTSAAPTDLTPSCFSCHKSHGNQNAFGLIYMENTGVVTEEGTVSGVYANLCNQCHVQGG